MPALDTYELSLDADYNGQQVTNIFKAVQIGGDGTGDARLALQSAFNVEIWPLFKPNLVADYEKQGYRSRGILQNETQQYIGVSVDNGTHAGEGLPPNCALLCRNYGTQVGRKGTGRNLFSGIPESQVLNGNWLTAYVALWVDYTNAMALNVADSGTGYLFRFGIYNSDLDAILNLQRLEIQPRCRTLRSRTIGAISA